MSSVSATRSTTMDSLIDIIGTEEGKNIFSVYSHTGYQKAVDSDYDIARAALKAVDEN